MAVQTPQPTRAQTELRVLVARDAAGDLTDGVRDRLAKLPGVEAVDTVDLHGVQPSLNDLRVDVTAELRVEVDPPDPEPAALERQLADGFGVRDVRVEQVRPQR